MPFSIDALPVEINLRIFNKLNPATYVRFRKTCHAIDDFCELYRRSLRIQNHDYRKPKLVLTNYPSSIQNWESPTWVVNVELERIDMDVVRSITEIDQSTVAFLRAAISGFYFRKVEIEDCCTGGAIGRPCADPHCSEKTATTIDCFIRATEPFLKPSRLNVTQTKAALLENLAGNWTLKKLKIETYDLQPTLLDTAVFQAVPEVKLRVQFQFDLVKSLQNKKIVRLDFVDYWTFDFTNLLPQLLDLLKAWKEGKLPLLENFQAIVTTRRGDFGNPKIFAELQGAYSLGYYPDHLWEGDISPNTNDKSEWYLYRMDGGRWGRIRVCWQYEDGLADVELREITTPEGFSREALCSIVENKCMDLQIPFDGSRLFEEMSGVVPGRVGEVISRQFGVLEEIHREGEEEEDRSDGEDAADDGPHFIAAHNFDINEWDEDDDPERHFEEMVDRAIERDD